LSTAARQLQSSTELIEADAIVCRSCFYPLHCTVFICSSLLPFVTLHSTTASATRTWTLLPGCDITQLELTPIWKKKKKKKKKNCQCRNRFLAICTSLNITELLFWILVFFGTNVNKGRGVVVVTLIITFNR